MGFLLGLEHGRKSNLQLLELTSYIHYGFGELLRLADGKRNSGCSSDTLEHFFNTNAALLDFPCSAFHSFVRTIQC